MIIEELFQIYGLYGAALLTGLLLGWLITRSVFVKRVGVERTAKAKMTESIRGKKSVI
jgi:hypothetical protein